MKTNGIQPALPFSIKDEFQFNEKCLEIFRYQYLENSVYRNFVDALNIDISKVERYSSIPFLPIEFFKSQEVICNGGNIEKVFQSSGTTGTRSKHFVTELSIYEQSFIPCFNQFFGAPEEVVIIGLLPNYVEQGDSSLVYMVNKLIDLTKDDRSGFYLDKKEGLVQLINEIGKVKKVVLFGVAYALLDVAEINEDKLLNTTVIETGGMKGRRKEMVREELHEILKKSFGIDHIYSEYGMTELLSQGYLKDNNRFETPSWMKVLVRDVNDPLTVKKDGKGGLNIIDLANINSCSFIATQDLGRVYEDGSFEVVGRFDNSDVRGCNLLVV